MSDSKPKKRLVSFADIAVRQEAALHDKLEPGKPPDAGRLQRVTYADLAALSKRPEDFPAPATSVTKELGIPDSESGDRGIPVSDIPIPGSPCEPEPDIGIPVLGASESGTPNRPVSSPPSLFPGLTPIRSGRPIRLAVRAQDGHSLGEQAVYEALWVNAKPYREDCRIISVGYRSLSSLCRLTANNCKANLQSLERKLAIEEAAGHSYTQGKTYLVYSYGAILRRRKAAGMTHYLKSRGVVFVDTETGREIGIPASGIPTPLPGIPDAGVLEAQPGIPGAGKAGIPEAATQKKEKDLRELSSSEWADLGELLARQDLRLDDDALLTLLSNCRQRAPDATLEEIAGFTREKWEQLRVRKDIQNLTGMLLVAVPRCFEGELLGHYRQARRQQIQRAEQRRRELERQLESTLTDPNASEEDRELARKLLDHPIPSE